jgi:hypothetical protein
VELTQITAEIHTASKRLSKGADALFLLAKANAEAEQQYRSALAKEIVKLKLEGMSVTLIPDIARGNTADLKFKRDIAEFKYTSGRDSLKAIAVQVTALQSILKYQEHI